MPRFDEGALRRAAGEAAFARGVGYAKGGNVRLISVTAQAVTAAVAGTEVYAVTLRGAGRAVSGGCECPAFEDRGFCKHLVAVALVVNGAPDAVAEVEARGVRIAAHLDRMERPVLVARLLAWAERQPELWRELDLEASIAAEPDDALCERLDAAIDAALDVDEYVDWRGAGAVAGDLNGVVAQIRQVLAGGRIAVALRALDRLLEDAETLLSDVDDSDGEVFGAFEEARDLHVEVCIAARPDPVALAQSLYEREVGSEFGLWEDCADVYADALRPEGAAEFRRLVSAAWRDAAKDSPQREQLRGMMDRSAQQDGDVDARIELRVADARSASDYHEIATLCLEAGRDRDALRWAEEGLWKSEDNPDAHLIGLAAHLCRRLGDDAKSQALLWDAFERAPSLASYKQLREGPAPPADIVDRAVALLTSHATAGGRRTWQNPADVLIEVLTQEDRRDDAWAAVSAYACVTITVETLALASETSHPDRALAAYASMAERSLASVTNEGYAHAIRYIARIDRLRRGLGRGVEQAAYLADLATRHKAKRNFIKLLNDPARWPKR